MADTKPELNLQGMAASLYALGMSFPGSDRVGVSLSLTPTFEVELSGIGVAPDGWLASASVEAYSLATKGDLPDGDIMVLELTLSGSIQTSPERAQLSLQVEICEKLEEEAKKAQTLSAQFRSLGGEFH